jgi:hypothetical protein
MKILDFLKKYWKAIVGTIIGALLVYLIIFVATPGYREYKSLKKENLVLQKHIDSLGKDNLLKQVKIDSLNTIDSVKTYQINLKDDQMARNFAELEKYKKLYHAKITNVNNYTAGDLDSFFRARYKGYYH